MQDTISKYSNLKIYDWFVCNMSWLRTEVMKSKDTSWTEEDEEMVSVIKNIIEKAEIE